MHNKLRLGMIGGGPGAMIGKIHRYAAQLDNLYELVCGVFSRDIKKSLQLNAEIGLDTQRVYACYQQMFEQESALPPEQRMQMVAIVTPNHSHFAIASHALKSGFDVILDKPVTNTLQEARELQVLLTDTKREMCVTYTYSGYPLLREARQLITTKAIGRIKKIAITFLQGWLTQVNTLPWRMDPTQVSAGTIADIGAHALYLLEYLSCERITHVYPLAHHLCGFPMEDDASLHCKLSNDAVALIHVSQATHGEHADLSIKIYGENGHIKWRQQRCNELILQCADQPARQLIAGYDNTYLSAATRNMCRAPAGHPEGYIEAFANHYRNFAHFLKAKALNITPLQNLDFPTLADGVRGLELIEQATVDRLKNPNMLYY